MSNIEDRLNSIEKRLSFLEEKIGHAAPTARINTQEEISPIHHEPVKLSTWLGLGAVICFILAAGFILKLSIESGFLNHYTQVGLAYLLGGMLILAGIYLLRADKRYASFLPAAGIIIGYLTTILANQLYHLMSFDTSLAVIGVTSLFCLGLYFKIREEIYPLIVSVGAYLTPICLTHQAADPLILYYFLICSFLFAAMSVLLKSRILIVYSATLSIIITSGYGFHIGQDKLLASLLAIHFFIFVIANYIYTLKNFPLTEEEAWRFFPALLLFYFFEYYFLAQINTHLAPWLSLGFAAFIFGVYSATKKHMQASVLPSEDILLSFLSIILFHVIYWGEIPHTQSVWLIAILIAIVAILPVGIFNLSDNKRYVIPRTILLIIFGVEYAYIMSSLIFDNSTFEHSWLAAIIGMLGIWACLIRYKKTGAITAKTGYVMLGLAHLLAISFLYDLTRVINSLAVTASWLCYAVLVMAFGYIQKDKIIAKSAIIILSVALLKALLFDAADAATIIRIFCLLLTGAVLYGAGFLMQKISSWENKM